MARSFNGTTDRLSNASPFVTGTGVLSAASFSAWVWTGNGAATMQVAIAMRADVSQYVALYLAGGKVRVESVGTAGAGTATTVASYPLNAWFHVGGWADTGGSTVFLNGANKVFTSHANNHNLTSAGSLTGVGSAALLGNFLSGRLAEVAVWSGTTNVLVDADMANLAGGANPAGIQAANLRMLCHLCGRASPEPDDTGNFPLTVSGATFIAHPPTQLSYNPCGNPGGGGGGKGTLGLGVPRGVRRRRAPEGV